MRRIAVLSACVLVGGVVAPTAALATDDPGHADGGRGSDSWIAVEDQFAVVLPDGTTYTENSPPPDEAGFLLEVGARLFIGEALYETEDGSTAGELVGRTYIECTEHIAPDTVRCDAAFVFTEGSQLHGSVLIDFATLDPDAPEEFDVAVTGGTGEFAGADGVISLLDTSDPADPEGTTTTRYTAHLG